MNVAPVKIIVIHDGLIQNDDPLLIALRDRFSGSQITHFVNSNEGLKFVLDNLKQKMIVLLDINFSRGEKSGVEVFEDIRKKTSLVHIIMITARNLAEIKSDELISMINHDALALENASNYPEIVSLVEKAMYRLEVRVDCILEEWIETQSIEDRNKPYIKMSDGSQYTLTEVLESIRQQTGIGIALEKNIMKLAVDLLVRQKAKLND
ncbi:MAG TPA: hypothetical protein VGD40_18845 [Chryseosolibacter sp.]